MLYSFPHSQINCDQGQCSTRNEPDTEPQRLYETQDFRDYGGGKHVASDKKLADLAVQDQEKAELERLEMENYSALCGESSTPAMGDDNVELVGTKPGGKGVWKGKFAIRGAETKKAKKEEMSLLD